MGRNHILKPHEILVTSHTLDALDCFGFDEIQWQFPFHMVNGLTMQQGDLVVIRTITAEGEENESRGHLFRFNGCHVAAVKGVIQATIWIERVCDPALTETPF